VASHPSNNVIHDILDLLEKRPKSPGAALKNWTQGILRKICQAPLKLHSEHTHANQDGHPYFVFALPHSNETPLKDFTPYEIREEAPTLIEFSSGACVLNPKKEIIANIPLGMVINLHQNKDPFNTPDQRPWGWPEIPQDPSQPKPKMTKISKTQSGLPEPTIASIDRFLRGIQPSTREWGLIQKENPESLAYYVQLPLPPKEADPTKMIEHLAWFTPRHCPWVYLW
jgi:hypothetical protein